MAPRHCEWCDEIHDDTNGNLTEDGKYWTCSDECLNNLEQNLAENEAEARSLSNYYHGPRSGW